MDFRSGCHWHFDKIISWSYHHQSIELQQAVSLSDLLEKVNKQLRSSQLRKFEAELNGRWLLVSEQTHQSGALIISCADITRQ